LYQPNDCEDDVFMRMVNCPPITGQVSFSGIESAISGAPFSVYTTWQCSTIGYSFEEQAARVRQRLDLRAQTAVERRLWQGQTSATDGDISGLFASAINLPAAACVTEAVEVLEQTLADNGVFGGIIHARPGMAAHLAQAHLLESRGPRRETPLGTPYVFGQGYSGIGPTGQAVTSDVEYLYASGRVSVWFTPDTWVPPVSEVVNKTTNVVYLVAQRIYAVTVECGVWAIPVTRNCATTGAT
jgi:hypothetical protein